jgi:presenilin-like A22 family membrane protease
MIAVAYISKLITELSIFVNVAFDGKGIKMLAQMIVRKYWYLKIEEIVFIFREAIAGKYGKVYGNLALMQILEWFAIHDNEKTEHFEQSHNEVKQLDVSQRTNFVIDTLGDDHKPSKWQRAVDFWKDYESDMKKNEDV